MILSTLIIAAATLAIFFSTLLISKHKTSSADKVLSTWLLVIFLQLTIYLLEINQNKYAYIWVEVSGAFVFLHGPILLLYFKLLKHPFLNNSRRFIIHFIPFGINLLLIPFLVIGENYIMDISMLSFKILSLVAYNLTILFKLSQHQKQIRQIYSEIESKELQWLKIIIISLLFITSLALISAFLTELEIIIIPLDGEFLIPIAVSFLITYIGYSGMKQTSIFLDFNDSEEKKESRKKYNNTGLDQNKSTKKFQAIKKVILEDRLFLEPQLKLNDVALATNISAHHLSQMINQNTNQNFYQFINTFRINEVLKNLHLGKHKQNTLLAIALDSGFNSKASFNRAFKNIVHMTPTEYINQLENNGSSPIPDPRSF